MPFPDNFGNHYGQYVYIALVCPTLFWYTVLSSHTSEKSRPIDNRTARFSRLTENTRTHRLYHCTVF